MGLPSASTTRDRLELPGRARLYADRGTGFLAVGDGETFALDVARIR